MHVVFNAQGQSDTEYILIRVFQPPMVNFGAPDNYGCVQPCHMVHFVNLTVPGESSVADSDYVWDFGDGTLPYQGYAPNHCYDSVGSFNVTLVARDSNGCQVNKIIPNYVVIGSPPVATLTANPTESCVQPRIVDFTGSGTSSNGPVSYEWYFGNGGTAAGQTTSTVYYNGIWNPYLIVSDSLGCLDTAYGQVAITDLVAGFTSSTVNACQGVAMQFIDTSNFAQKWLWNFGDGDTSTAQNPFHTYTTNGAKTVSLIIYYNNCTDTVVENNYINVTTPVSITFSGSPTTSCTTPLTVNFTSTAPGATAFNWSFGDGNTSQLQNPSNTYTSKGAFNVTLSVTNSHGCVNSLTKNNYVSIADINASFTVDSFGGCTPVPINFTSTSTSNPPITNYQWNFGDTTAIVSGNNPNPIHTYTKQGQFYPTLVVTNSAGCVDTFTLPEPIKVGDKLIPNFIGEPLTQCVDQPVIFTDTTQGVNNTTQFLWSFGDGSTSTLADPTHTYRDTGSYTVTLTVINQGCVSDTIRLKYVRIVVPKADFDFKTTCTNNIVATFIDTSIGADTWLWNFGDGSPTSTLEDPTHIYDSAGTYKVKLTVTNSTTGCVDSITKTIQVGASQAGFMAALTSGCFPLLISFHDTSKLANSWFWNFGDGYTSIQQNPSHSYNDTGSFKVYLIVTSSGGCVDSIGKPHYITVYGAFANYGISPTVGCEPLKATFTDSSISYSGTISAWHWQFDAISQDTSDIQNPHFTYNAVGTLTSKLTVTDSHGCKASASKTVQVINPIAGFTSDTAVCPGEPIQFTNTSQNAGEYLWYFGDGDTSTQTNPKHTYANSGTYSVTLIAKSTVTGCPDTLVQPNYLNVDSPNVDFYVTSAFAPCPPFPVQFYNITTRPGLQYSWDFGDGGSANAIDPLHVYFYPGNYTVTLTVKDTAGCTGSKTYVDLIRIRGPMGTFSLTPDSGCVPLTISITGSVKSTVSIVANLGDGPAYYDTVDLVHTYQTPGVYYPVYTLTDSLGCTVGYTIDTVVVGLIPYPGLPPDTTICQGNYIQFNLPYGDRFQWKSDAIPDYLSCDTCQNPLSTTPDTLTYIVTAMTNIGCAATDTVKVNVDPLPDVQPGVMYRICVDDTLQLSAGINVSSVVWTPNLFIDDTTNTNPKVWPTDSTTYRVTAGNEAGCTISRVVQVYPINKVDGGLALHDTMLCEGQPIQLQAQVTEASYDDTFYRWVPNQFLNSPYISNPILSLPPTGGDYDYQVIISSEHCTPDTDNIHIVIAPNPELQAGNNQTVATGTNVELWASSTEDAGYLWTSSFDSLSCTTCSHPSLTATQTETVIVKAETQYGCKSEDSVLIRVVDCDESTIFVPNTFTPNGDHVNDVLYVRGIGLIQLEYFRIYDRWGRLVWETKDISEGWDGTEGGKMADIATYVYELKATCSSGSTIEKSGNVTLIR